MFFVDLWFRWRDRSHQTTRLSVYDYKSVSVYTLCDDYPSSGTALSVLRPGANAYRRSIMECHKRISFRTSTISHVNVESCLPARIPLTGTITRSVTALRGSARVFLVLLEAEMDLVIDGVNRMASFYSVPSKAVSRIRRISAPLDI